MVRSPFLFKVGLAGYTIWNHLFAKQPDGLRDTFNQTTQMSVAPSAQIISAPVNSYAGPLIPGAAITVNPTYAGEVKCKAKPIREDTAIPKAH